MEIVILVFFIAIFGGILFLLGLVWFIYRRIRNSGQGGRNFAGGSKNYGGAPHQPHRSFTDSDDDAGAIFAGSALFANQEPENAVYAETAADSPYQSADSTSHESRGAYGAPAETSYTESSYSSSDTDSSYDSGASYDSSSSSDSGSSDSGGSSSSSD